MAEEGAVEPDQAPQDQVVEPGEPLFTYLCPNPNCRVRNNVFDEEKNLCFNCGSEMFLNPAEREARWYQEAGRRRRDRASTTLLFGMALCVVGFLGIPLVVEGVVEGRRGKREQDRGRQKNQEAGGGGLPRANLHWVEMGTRAISTPLGPEGQGPKDYDFEDAGWLKPFGRAYYLCWVLVWAFIWITTTASPPS